MGERFYSLAYLFSVGLRIRIWVFLSDLDSFFEKARAGTLFCPKNYGSGSEYGFAPSGSATLSMTAKCNSRASDPPLRFGGSGSELQKSGLEFGSDPQEKPSPNHDKKKPVWIRADKNLMVSLV